MYTYALLGVLEEFDWLDYFLILPCIIIQVLLIFEQLVFALALTLPTALFAGLFLYNQEWCFLGIMAHYHIIFESLHMGTFFL